MKRTAVFANLLLIMSQLMPGSPAYGQTFQLLRTDLQALIDSAATEGMRMSVGIISLHDGTGDEPLLLGSPVRSGKELAMVVFSESSITTDLEQAQAQLNPWVAQAAGLIYRSVK